MSPSVTTTNLPLHILLRRRREKLSMLQWEVAEALHVSPECATAWEAGRRRMEIDKIPRIAAVLQLDARELCARALEEFHPAFYQSLFGDCALGKNIHQTI
jgi:DNA-binding XRE family transcriptional regulator